MQRAFIIYLLILVSWTSSVDAQLMFNIPEMQDSCAKSIYLDFSSSSFIKNNEYNGPFTRGFTGIGILYNLKYNTMPPIG